MSRVAKLGNQVVTQGNSSHTTCQMQHATSCNPAISIFSKQSYCNTFRTLLQYWKAHSPTSLLTADFCDFLVFFFGCGCCCCCSCCCGSCCCCSCCGFPCRDFAFKGLKASVSSLHADITLPFCSPVHYKFCMPNNTQVKLKRSTVSINRKHMQGA